MTRFIGLDLLDGGGLRRDQTLKITGGRIADIASRRDEDTGTDLSRDGRRALVTPGLIDLQVNGGGGLMLADCHDAPALARMVTAHAAGGTGALLPTLISATPEVTVRVVDLVAALAAEDAAILGLHLEGPHLARAGVHAQGRLRPLMAEDMELYRDAAARLPHLVMTVAPEVVPPIQIAALTAAGIRVFLGHSDCDYDTAMAAFDAGAVGVTHLFNAMSGLHHRAPGLAGAALDAAPAFGMIVDGLHVHPAAIRLAARARRQAICLVTDSMAVAGTKAAGFQLDGHRITRSDGRLTRSDGTLAGADLTMAAAVQRYAAITGLPFVDAVTAGFDAPHRVLTGQPCRILPGQTARLLHWSGDRLEGWIGG